MSLLIFAGIVSRWSDINSIVTNVVGKVKVGEWLYSLIGILTAVAMLAAVWFVTYSDGAERRVPVQYAARTQRVRILYSHQAADERRYAYHLRWRYHEPSRNAGHVH